jgi:hypothetical protein
MKKFVLVVVVLVTALLSVAGSSFASPDLPERLETRALEALQRAFASGEARSLDAPSWNAAHRLALAARGSCGGRQVLAMVYSSVRWSYRAVFAWSDVYECDKALFMPGMYQTALNELRWYVSRR